MRKVRISLLGLLQKLDKKGAEIDEARKAISSELGRLGFAPGGGADILAPIPGAENDERVRVYLQYTKNGHLNYIELEEPISCDEAHCSDTDCDGCHYVPTQGTPFQVISALAAYRQKQIEEKEKKLGQLNDIAAALKEV